MEIFIYKLNEKVFEGMADSITMPGIDGEITILKNHIPLISRLKKEPPTICGFQFLLGIIRRTWKELADNGERVAIYVPFGKNWLPYAKRRWKYIVKKIPAMICGN